ncbi:MAG: hypothetical protein GIX03_03750 [Candidatus Eremiobacteraeota bacterium]|nr:hypothetical protein [Candidatus Eremiobacteraeota bacterium]MBC5802127.1 hypothetical protein [Candidatus Eremiobacteraeota bacterium]MBC5820951.1 hypothetical protein [Candidatus Eremiobacteraeota bacterium]
MKRFYVGSIKLLMAGLITSRAILSKGGRLRFISRVAVTLVALPMVGVPGQANPIIAGSRPVVAIPFRLPPLPPPPFQTAAQLAAANQYWATHSIPFNHAERQTPAEAAASRYWQLHPRNGQADHFDVRPNDYCPQLQRTAQGRVKPNVGQCPPPVGSPDFMQQGGCYTVFCSWDDFADKGPSGPATCYRDDGYSDGVCNVAVHRGPIFDHDTCDQQSMAVGDTVGQVGGKPRTIVDENEIFQADGLPYNHNGVLTVSSHVWGWIYKDNAGQFWTQINPAFQWTSSFSTSINAWGSTLGISLNAPTGSAPKEGVQYLV